MNSHRFGNQPLKQRGSATDFTGGPVTEITTSHALVHHSKIDHRMTELGQKRKKARHAQSLPLRLQEQTGLAAPSFSNLIRQSIELGSSARSAARLFGRARSTEEPARIHSGQPNRSRAPRPPQIRVQAAHIIPAFPT